MKKNKLPILILLVVVIVGIILISFFGVYIKDKNAYVDILKNYNMGMDFTGKRILKIIPNNETKEVTYDSEGNEIEAHTHEEDEVHEGETTEEVPINPEEVLTEENYVQSKKILETRIASTGIEEYNLRVDKTYGTIWLETQESVAIDQIVGLLLIKGRFSVEDNDTGEVVLDSSHLGKSKIVQNNPKYGAYLSIGLNKEGSKKVEELKTRYLELENTEQEAAEEGSNEKTLVLKIDDEVILTLSYKDLLGNKELIYPISTRSSTDSQLQSYAIQAANILMILESGEYRVEYVVETDQVILATMTKYTLCAFIVVCSIIAILITLYLVARYKDRGAMLSIAGLGYVAVLLLILRFTNSTITISSVVSITLSAMLNYVFIFKVLQKPDTKITEKIIQFIYITIPLFMIALVFCFGKHLNVNSFGMALFWGTMIFIIYSFLFTKTLYNMVEVGGNKNGKKK